MFAEFGRALIFLGVLLLVIGLAIVYLPSLRLGRLPGDISISLKNGKIYIPIATSVLLSIILSLLLWVANWLRR